MNKKFTKLIAALALLVFMTPTMAGWGQVSSVAPANGNSYVVAAYVNSKYYALPCQTTNGGQLTGVEVTLNTAGKVDPTNASGKTWTLEEGTGNNAGQYYFKYTNGSSTYYLYKNGTSTSNHNFKVSTGDKNYWSFTTNGTGYTVAAVDRGTNNINIQYNSGTFGCYGTATPIILLEIGNAGPTITGLSCTGTPATTTYEAGDSFDPTGLTVTAIYSDESTQDVTASVEWTPDPLTQGTTSVIGTYSGLTVTVPGITVNAPAGPDIVLNYSNSPFTATGGNTNTETVTLDGIEYASFAGYKFDGAAGTFISITRDQQGYLGNNTQLCGNIKKIVVDYYSGNASWFTMYEGSTALPETTTVSPSGSGTGSITYTFSGNNGYFKFKRTTTGTGYTDYCNINSISIYLKDCNNPEITVSPNSLSGFTYVEGNGPSEAQTFTVSGANLTANLNMSLGENSDFEISQSENNGYANSIALTPSDGTVANTTIYACLKAGKAKGNYSGTITLTSTDATNKTVSLSGTVTSQTYTLSDQSGENGSISFSASPVEAGTHVTLTPTPVSDAYYFVPGSWSFFNESLEEVTSSIVFVTGETNVIEMPAFNLLVDASFQAKPTHNVTIASGIENGTVTADPTSAYAGQAITLTVTPGTNCYLTSLTATYVDDNQETQELTITNNTFVMPNYNVTVTATFASNAFVGSFVLYSGTLTEGDYLIVYDNGAMNNVVTSNRFGFETVSPTQNIITDPSKDIVWHIAASETEGYWTIFNAKKGQYANNGNGNGTTVSLVDPNYAGNGAKWQVTGTDTYEFRNKANVDYVSSNPNANVRYLRKNGTSGFASYTTGYGDALTLYKLIPPTAPVWSALPTPSIYTGNEYELTLTDYVTGNPVPNISLATGVSSTLYEYEDGYFTFQTNTAGTYEFTFTATNSQGSVSATLTITVAAPEEYDLTVTLDDHVTGIFVFNAANQNNPLIANGAAGTVQVLEGTSIIVSPDVAEGYALESLIVNNTDVTSQIDESGAYTFTVTGDVTITATAVFNPYVTLTGEQMANMTNHGTTYGTGASYLKYITIDGYYWEANAYQQSSTSQYLQINTTGSGNPKGSYIKLPVFNGKIEEITCTTNSSDKVLYFNTTNSASNPIANEANSSTSTERTIDLTDVFYQTGYIVSSGSIQITHITVRFSPYQDMTGTTLETIGNDATVSIPANANVTATNLTIPASSGIVINAGATLTVSGTLTNAGNANNIIIKDGGKLITTSTGVQATVEKNITGAGDENWTAESGAAGWYFIASPVNDAAFPTGTVNDQDIYQLDWANNNWINLQNSSHSSLLTAGFQRGTGYLYASKDGNTISVAGEIQPLSNDHNATVTLANHGWNLIGNPLTCKVTVDHDFGMLNNGSTVDYTGTIVNPCQGIVVWGSADEEVIFTKAATQNAAAPGNSALQMTVAQNIVTRGNATSTTVDNAVISFNEGSVLPKFTMLESNANLYIPQGIEEYAIVSSNGQGEMPVNFRANENGQYILTVNAENVEMNYLHLIDNMTGADIDLLQTPSYTFNAKTYDYESRFRLVFAANNEDGSSTGSETFSFYSNGNWVINNEGDATLQVIDALGRILSNEGISGTVSKSIDAPAGVYVLRLINGENVKTQKIVVR